MANLGQSFDVNDIPESTNSYEPLPEGWYPVVIQTAELKATKDGTGSYISIKYGLSGSARTVYGNINIRNQSQKAEEIGRQNLGEIMRAIGLSRVTDSDELIGGNLMIKLVIKDDQTYGRKNEVKGYKAIEGAPAPKSMPKPAAAPAAAGKAAPPWAK
jgi:hypothetical protein